jgi:hypothetical protein
MAELCDESRQKGKTKQGKKKAGRPKVTCFPCVGQ